MPTHPYLATLQRDTTGSGNWTDIGQLVTFTPPKISRGVSDTTHLGSTGKTRTNAPGWRVPGEVPFRIHFDSANYNTLHGLFTSDVAAEQTQPWRVRYNDGTSATTGTRISFTGWIKELGVAEASRDEENPLAAEGIVHVSGIHTVATAT